MSAELDALCEEVREANAAIHDHQGIEVIVGGLRQVYKAMRKKGYSNRASVESARNFYITQTQRRVWNGQHR